MMTTEEAIARIDRMRDGAMDPGATREEYMRAVAARMMTLTGTAIDVDDPVAFLAAVKAFNGTK